jgi:carboxypeptidase PM20D1
MSVFDHFDNENMYPGLDQEGAVSRLSRAISFRTLNNGEFHGSDAEFEALQDHIRASYPHVMQAGSFELIGRAVLITIPGSDPGLKPSLYMAHQDVVPVVDGTEDDWKYAPYSGAVAEDAVWGRGTLDIKNMLFGILEAAEYLLSSGSGFRRTAYLAFGDDEETMNLGAKAIAETLRDRGVTLEFVLDEGGGVIRPGDVFGAPDVYVASVDILEKGYADLELSVKSIGGHSSRPFGGSSLEKISRAITRIADDPFPNELPDPVRKALETLAPYITEAPLDELVKDIEGNRDEIARYLSQRPETFAFVTTTIAPTMITGGSSACNVLPQDMSAVINFRINQGTTAQQVMEHCRKAVDSDEVQMRFIQSNDPSDAARTDGFGFDMLTSSAEEFFKEVVFIPCMTTGATDAYRYGIVCDTCLRFSPFMVEPEEEESGVHGTNEHIPVRSYMQGIRFLIRMMERCNQQS